MYSINDNNNSIIIEVSVKKIISLLLFFTVISIALLILITREFILMFTENHVISSTIFGPIIFLILFSMYVLWLLYGTEKIIIKDSYLLEVKSNSIFSIKRKFELNKIKNIKIKDDNDEKLSFIELKKRKIIERRRAFPFWYKMGSIEFEYNNRTITILSGLEKKEANEIIALIKKETSKYSSLLSDGSSTSNVQ